MATHTTYKKSRKGVLVEISERPISFAFAFLAFFFISLAFFSVMGVTPDPITADATLSSDVPASSVTAEVPANPENAIRVVAKDISLDVTVVNPSSTDIEDLDKALESGAVHYPTSAPLGVNGTVLLFGHSSYLPVVYHQYYKTFDGIQNLKNGEVVSVYSGTTEYRYKVTGVRVADSTDEDDNKIALPSDAKYLTLVTCDSFAAKSNRFIVTAAFAGAYPLE
jgi:LPXTG-site transpeptidase (sortase) family protein